MSFRPTLMNNKKWVSGDDNLGIVAPLLNALSDAIQNTKKELCHVLIHNDRPSDEVTTTIPLDTQLVDEMCDTLLASYTEMLSARNKQGKEDLSIERVQHHDNNTLRPPPVVEPRSANFHIDDTDALLFCAQILNLFDSLEMRKQPNLVSCPKHLDPTLSTNNANNRRRETPTMYSNFLLLKWCAAVSSAAPRYGLTPT